MIRLNRTSEYGLIALRHMSRKGKSLSTHSDPKSWVGSVTSAREVADVYGLPFEMTAKSLLRLKDAGLIHAEQGAKGGYLLKRPLEEVSLAEFLELMEGPQAVVMCTTSEEVEGCAYTRKCEIKHLMGKINQRLVHFLSEIFLTELEEDFTKGSPT